MRAAQYTGNKSIVVSETMATAPSAGEVQIAVAYVGLCGTDLHVLHGHMDARVSLPATIGHEMSGTIHAVGSEVNDWAVGDRVTVMPLDWDSTCPACRAGNQHVCHNLNFIGIDSPGALQSLWNVGAEHVIAVPPTLRLDHAALIEPVSVAVHDVRRSELRRGDKAVVIGAGPIGLLIASVARIFGAEVLLIELDTHRREFASTLGFEVLDPSAVDQVDAVEKWTNGAGADVVFEVSGAAAAVRGATALAKVRGTIVVVAIHPTPRELDLQRVFWRELRILGARVYEREDFEEAVCLLNDGLLPADSLISQIVVLDDIADAFTTMEEGAAIKILVDVQAGGAV